MAGDDVVTEEDLFEELEAALADFPHLRGVLPTSFPRGPRFGISLKKMEEYAAGRQRRFWHHVNLPLALHSYKGNPDARVREFFRTVLQTLDDFVDRLGKLPGARSLLSPIWDDPWTDSPQLWTVASCAYVSLCYQTDGMELIGFESTISGQLKDDITVRIKDKVTHLEVEAHHLSEFAGKSDQEVLAELERRAQEKAGKKFAALPEGHVGVVAILCVPTGEDVERKIKMPLSPLPGRMNVGWTAWSMTGIAHPDGPRFVVLWL